MKRIICYCVYGFMLIWAISAPAIDFSPFQLSLWPPVQVIPGDNELTVGGLRIDVPYGRNARVFGLDVGVINRTDELAGLQIGLVNPVHNSLTGLQVGGFNRVMGDVQGCQLGVWNQGGKVRGLQLGVVNIADSVAGLQLGLVNIVRNRSAGILPLANAGF